MLVPVWIVGGVMIFFYKQLHCSSMPAANTFEGNLNLLIILIFGVFYIYADTEKMQIVDKNIYIGFVSLVLIFIFFIGTGFLIIKQPQMKLDDKNENLITSNNTKNTIFCGRCYKEPLNIGWYIVYIIMTLILILYVIFYDVFGLITWLTLFIIYMLLVTGLSLFRRKSDGKKALNLSMLSMILVVITVGVEFIFEDVCMKISPKRYIYPVLTGILVIIIRLSKHFTNNTPEIPFST